MGQKSEPPMLDQIFIVGLDQRGIPCGARFTILRDSIVSAAIDLNCRVFIRQPDPVAELGMNLPVGTVYGTGKLVTLSVPNISRDLYRRIVEAARMVERQRECSSKQLTAISERAQRHRPPDRA